MKRTSRAISLLAATAALFVLVGCAAMKDGSLGTVLSGGQAGSSPDEGTIAAGLKEALRVGTERTVDHTSRLDGFLANELIRIAMPEELESMAGLLRTVGLGGQVDEMEVAMNRAAEKASGEAIDVFVGAIREMTIGDVYAVWKGPDDAATEYFRGKTSDALRFRFRPIVTEKMEEVGLVRVYNSLTDRYAELPLTTRPALDLEDYVTEKTLGGLFTVLASEEKRIREDPTARTTDLLRTVFGAPSE